MIKKQSSVVNIIKLNDLSLSKKKMMSHTNPSVLKWEIDTDLSLSYDSFCIIQQMTKACILIFISL